MASQLMILLIAEFQPTEAQTWIKSGYWLSGSGFPISDINSSLFTHLICAFADVNSSSYQLYVSFSDEQYFSAFTSTVKLKNPSITTLLSIGGGKADYGVFSLMFSSGSYRKSFIESSIRIARHYGFQGLDLSWVSANTSSDMANLGILFEEWRAAANSEASNNSSNQELILTAAVHYSPVLDSASFPVDSIRTNLNWIHVLAFDYYVPQWSKFTGAHAALHDPSSETDTDDGIKEWIGRGVSPSKLVLGLPLYGYAWTLESPQDNAIGAPATGPAIRGDGSMSYKAIKDYINSHGATSLYNATYVVNYCTIGSTWIGFDDVEVVKIKVSYAKEWKLRGYVFWQVSQDDKSVLSLSAQEDNNNGHHKWRLLVIILTTTAAVLLIGIMMFYLRKRIFKSKDLSSPFKLNVGARGHFDDNAPDVQILTFSDIEMATDKFSFKNKLGEGGYGPVYKGILPNGQEIAVKKLSKTSKQGFEEFKNEVTFSARLQHVNLVRVLGFCTEREEQMLVYEYMTNKSLDTYIFDLNRRFLLDWRKRVLIIEGVTQGLLYLQEYSRFTIIHRDLKASNILLDHEMKPKISDFGLARIFAKDEHEVITSKVVGTYGYVPPEYVKNGLYSTKSDVYSFGVLLLQMISGKKTEQYYGVDEDLNLMEYAYQLWKEGKGMEFVDPSVDDTSSPCKLMRCLQVALLCIEENANDRPSMLEISSMLRNDNTTMGIPKKPAFSRKNVRGDAGNNSSSQLEVFSVNDVTTSQICVR
ncbi:cysteine-rich receptor-like protein kinase 21 [Quillaja saponaria]|uniref:non-specific serine/threonine protein kinase n=1 Tax=Quillaja saponaria TaxID=32244 RepID=A0AAD7QDV9_QUISA|nr:cysteine-rich receptor-like protein kinase 21 [Quillaja saponaria]